MRICVFVAGPARSGTSVCAGVLNALGVPMGPRFFENPAWYPKGSFCDVELLWLSNVLVNSRQLDDPPSRLAPSDPAWAAWEFVIQKRCEQPLWGVKCHSLLAFLPRFAGVLAAAGVELRMLLTSRNPSDAHNSLATMRRGDATGAARYQADCEKLISSFLETFTGRRLAVTYEGALADRAGFAREVADFAGLAPDSNTLAAAADFIEPDLQRFPPTRVP